MQVVWLKDLRLADLERRIAERLGQLDPNDVTALAQCGAEVRGWVTSGAFPEAIIK